MVTSGAMQDGRLGLTPLPLHGFLLRLPCET